jgi:hypothetical protein
MQRSGRGGVATEGGVAEDADVPADGRVEALSLSLSLSVGVRPRSQEAKKPSDRRQEIADKRQSVSDGAGEGNCRRSLVGDALCTKTLRACHWPGKAPARIGGRCVAALVGGDQQLTIIEMPRRDPPRGCTAAA